MEEKGRVKKVGCVLSVIIPQYKESESQVKVLFDMLNNQQNVEFNDFEVIVVNDCSDFRLSAEFLSQFKNLRIKSLRTKKNVGSGLCRQFGIEHSVGEYIMFIDADDTIYNLLAINTILHNIKENSEADIFQGQFLREAFALEGKGNAYVISDGITWVHSKIYKRQFLVKYGIEFPKIIRVNEDCYFNTVAFNLANKIVKIKEPLTIYRLNKDSLTNVNNRELEITGFPDFVISQELSLVKVKPFLEYTDYLTLVVRMFCFFYFNGQKERFRQNDMSEFRVRIRQLILLFYKKHRNEILSVSEMKFNEIYKLVRDSLFNGANFREKETIEQYYNRLIEENKKNAKIV